MILAFILYVLFALIFIFGKISLGYGSPIFAVGVRMLIAGFILMGYLLWKNPKALRIRKKDILPIVLVTIFNVYLTNVLEFWGLQYLVSAKASFLYNLSPFLTALLSYFVFYEKMTKRKIIGLVGGFIGFLPILMSESQGELASGHIGFFSWPELALLGAATATTVGWIALRTMVTHGFSPIAANAWSMLITGFLCIPTSLVFETWNPFPVVAWKPFLGWTLIIAMISNLICYNLYGYLLKRYSATLMAFLGFFSPFIAAIVGWLVLGETVTWNFVTSAVIVFVSFYLFYKEELRQGYIKI
ncbi:DMT family transporter [Candidatus Babeliales bacterium]|nr:DMT family transporter [Candidatus Babeliales bacterium]